MVEKATDNAFSAHTGEAHLTPPSFSCRLAAVSTPTTPVAPRVSRPRPMMMFAPTPSISTIAVIPISGLPSVPLSISISISVLATAILLLDLFPFLLSLLAQILVLLFLLLFVELRCLRLHLLYPLSHLAVCFVYPEHEVSRVAILTGKDCAANLADLFCWRRCFSLFGFDLQKGLTIFDKLICFADELVLLAQLIIIQSLCTLYHC
mmetsp:Transcript_3001/g.7676  ORF Transcript_3001/g.7676 Transcript_3001/m.7676 type:complete len:207 (-) Transcript_3001:555-1175(-)